MSVVKKIYVTSIIGYPETKDTFALDGNTSVNLVTNKDNKLEIRSFHPCLTVRSIKEAVEETVYYLRQSANTLAHKFKVSFNLNESLSPVKALSVSKARDQLRLTGHVEYDVDPKDKVSLMDDHSSEFVIEMAKTGSDDLTLKYYQINLEQESQKEFVDAFIIFLREGADLLEEKLK